MQSKIKATITNLEAAWDIAISESKANKEKSAFISNISHELRTPMHAILSFGNLGITHIDNALKFSESNTTIEILIFEKIVIHKSIKDEGVGIPENELLDIFDSFSQSSRTITGAGGTGLGLSISKHLEFMSTEISFNFMHD